MYSDNKNFLKDFAERTKINYQNLNKGTYEVTQLINSMVGLLIIPEQKAYDRICDNLISAELLNKLKGSNCLKQYTYNKSLDLKQICRHLRNAVSHSHLKFESTQAQTAAKTSEIELIIFTDKDRYGHCFEMQLSIELLQEFLFEFSSAISKLER